MQDNSALAKKRRVMSNTGRKVIGVYNVTNKSPIPQNANADIIHHLD